MREHSAGGVVIREHDGRYELAAIRPAHRAVLALPKGHVDPGETPEVAAQREVLEETGLTVCFEGKLLDIDYVYQFRGKRIFKRVSFFLFRHLSGEIDAI